MTIGGGSAISGATPSSFHRMSEIKIARSQKAELGRSCHSYIFCFCKNVVLLLSILYVIYFVPLVLSIFWHLYFLYFVISVLSIFVNSEMILLPGNTFFNCEASTNEMKPRLVWHLCYIHMQIWHAWLAQFVDFFLIKSMKNKCPEIFESLTINLTYT